MVVKTQSNFIGMLRSNALTSVAMPEITVALRVSTPFILDPVVGLSPSSSDHIPIVGVGSISLSRVLKSLVSFSLHSLLIFIFLLMFSIFLLCIFFRR